MEDLLISGEADLSRVFVMGVKVLEIGRWGPVHGLIWTLAACAVLKSPKELGKEDAVSAFPVHGSVD